MNVLRRWWLVLAAALLANVPTFGQSKVVPPTGPMRVALLVSEELPAARSVQDLALAALSNDKGLDLLDRATVNKLLQEQKLSLSGLVDAGKAVAVGKILAAELLAVIDVAAASKQNVALVVYDAATGVRLVDRGFSETGVAEQAQETAAGIRAAARAWQAGTRHLKTVCFLPARNADLPTYLDPFFEAMASMLERQLLHQPGVAALERKRLEGFSREKELAASAAARELLASVLLLELEFAQGKGKKSIRATILVRDHAGKLLHTISHEVTEADKAALLEPLTEKLQAALNTAEGKGVVKRSREAQRFLREAETLWRHKLFLQGLQAAEAAYALQGDDEARLLLAEYLFAFADEQLKPGVLQLTGREWKALPASGDQVRAGLSMALRADQLVELGKARGTPAPTHLIGHWSLSETGTCCYNQAVFAQELSFIKIEPPDAQVEDEVRAFRNLLVQRNLERFRELAKRCSPKELAYLTSTLFDPYMPRLAQDAPDSAAAIKAFGEALQIWLDSSTRLRAEDFPPECGHLLAQRVLPYLYEAGAKQQSYSRQDREATLPLLETLKKHPHPVIGLYAEHVLVKQLRALDKIDAAEAEQRRRQSVASAKDWIEKVAFKDQTGNRVAFYYFLYHTIFDQAIPSGDRARAVYLKKQMQEYLDLLDHMVERRDVVGHVWILAINWFAPKKDFHAQAVPLIARMRAAAAAPAPRVFADPSKLLKTELDRAEWRMLTLSPHLAPSGTGAPWDKVTKLVELKSLKHANSIIAPVLHDGHIYFFTGGYDPEQNNRPLLRLFKVPVAGGPAVALGQVHVAQKDYDPKQPQRALYGHDNYFIEKAIIHRGHIYAGTRADGIYAFPLDGGAPQHIGEAEGLPSLEVITLVGLEDKLAAILQGGYLVVHDLPSNRCQVIASSRRTQKLSPFDNAKPFVARTLAADSERRRVLVPVMQEEPEHPNTGLWEYNIETQQFKKLLPFWAARFSQVQGDDVYLQGLALGYPTERGVFFNFVGRLHLPSDQFTLLHGKCPKGIARQEPAGLPKDFSAAFPEYLFHQGYIWKMHYFGRRPFDGGKDERLTHVTSNLPVDVWIDFLAAVSPNELLLGDRGGLYRVRLK